MHLIIFTSPPDQYLSAVLFIIFIASRVVYKSILWVLEKV